MHLSLLLALWSLVAFILYKGIRKFDDERRHRLRARQMGCQMPIQMPNRDPLGIDNIKRMLRADREYRMPAYLKGRLDELSEREGKVVTTTYLYSLGQTGIFTIEPKNIQAILAIQFKDYGLGNIRNENFAPLLGHGIFSSDGKQWEHGRALLRPQFARDQISDLDLEERHIQNLIRRLPAFSSGWTDVTNIQPLFFNFTMDSATEFLFGESIHSQLADLPGYYSQSSSPVDARDFAPAFDKAQACIARAARFGNFYWLAHDKEFKENCKICHAFIDYFVQNALNARTKEKSSETGKHKYVFAEALAEHTRNPIEIREQMISILLAGRDTTAALLSYVFILLTQHPDVFRKLRATIIDDFGTYSNPKNLNFASLKNCTYLQWVMNETLRLYPLVPIDGRRSLVDTTIPTGGGPDGKSPIYIPKGTPVDYSTYGMHRRKDLWGPDAEEFKPERWNSRKPGWEYLPFNGGPRICIGQQFALTEGGYAIVRLLQRFDGLEGVGNTWEPVEKGGLGWVRMKVSLTSSPADGVKLRLREAKE